MNPYQRKTLLIVLAINIVFGLQQYLINQAVVFPSPINAIVFLFASVFFFFKAFFKGTKLEKLLLSMFVLVAGIQLFSDSFVMEIAFSSNHEQVYDWINSKAYMSLQTIGVVLLLATVPIIAYAMRDIDKKYFFAGLGSFVLLLVLAFFKVPLEPLIALGLLALLFFVVLIKHNQQILAGVSAAMHLWLIFFFNELFEYWNLSL